MLNITESNCWPDAYELIANGEIEKAIRVCESEPCALLLECQRFLGWRYYEKDDFEAALNWFGKAVEQGDAEAAFGVGSVYFVRRSFPAAAQYFKQAADGGYGRACHWLGYIYRQGLGVSRSDDAAVNWYKQGAAQGYLVAERALMHLVWIRGGAIARIRTLPRYLYIVLKAAVIALRDIHDQRIVDIPNAFLKSPRKAQS